MVFLFCFDYVFRLDVIYLVRYDGFGYMEVFRGYEFLSYLFVVTLYGGEVYWIDWRINMLVKVNKWIGYNVIVV